jgi:DNA-binding XRE family transcriptional regulator/mannose-6-phosphate isomerase-like protein (cupin superfamily)
MAKRATERRSDAENSDEASVGLRLRALRRERELSIAQLALKAGVSTGIVSQMERGTANPSLRTLERVRVALGVPLMALLEDISAGVSRSEAARDPAFVRRRASRPHLKVGTDGYAKQILSPQWPTDGLRFMIITIPTGVSSEEVLIGAGEKAGLVLGGKLHLSVDDGEAILSEGDSFQFPSDVPHNIRNDGPQDAEVLWIINMKPLAPL